VNPEKQLVPPEFAAAVAKLPEVNEYAKLGIELARKIAYRNNLVKIKDTDSTSSKEDDDDVIIKYILLHLPEIIKGSIWGTVE
jgi:hypothetical protein